MAELNPVEELNHYYKDCILHTRDKYQKYPFYVSEFRDNGEYIYIKGMSLYDSNKEWVPANLDASEIEYDFPELGMVNAGHTAVYTTRTPERQYKKGIVPKLLNRSPISPILDNILASRGKTFHPNDLRTYWSIFNNAYHPIDYIINGIERGELLSQAFSNTLCIAAMPYTKTLCLFYKTTKVGFLKDKIAFIHNKNKHLVEEISQYIRTEVY